MSTRSFVAFFTEDLRDLVGILTPNEFKIYVLMATYADGRTGRCYPGVPELSEKSGLHFSTVERVRGSLEQKGLIGCVARNRRDEYTGRALPNVYDICGPLRTKNNVTDPQNTPMPAFTRKHENGITRINNKNQLTRRIKQESVTSSSNHNPLRGPLMESADDTAVPFEPLPTELSNDKGKSKDKGQQQYSQNAAQHTEPQERGQSSSPSSAAPSPRNLEPFHEPLPDMERERIAATIEAECETTTPIAREMAAAWEPDAIKAALGQMYAAAAAGRIKKSKFGFVKWQLENNAIAQPDIAKAQRRAALDRIAAPGVLHTDHETGEVCQFISRAGNQLMMQSESGQHFTITVDDAIRLYGQTAAAGD